MSVTSFHGYMLYLQCLIEKKNNKLLLISSALCVANEGVNCVTAKFSYPSTGTLNDLIRWKVSIDPMKLDRIIRQ
jgi:hypothetical protein